MIKLPAHIRFFCIRAVFFLLPIAALFIFPLLILWDSGELIPVNRVVEIQQTSTKPVLVGLSYSNPEKQFKLASFLARRSDVVILGNSHIMTFREDFFKEKNFYNAAVGGSRLPDFMNFVEQIPPGRQPRVLIAGLDPFFAKPDFDWSKKEEERFDRKAGPLGGLRIVTASWKKVYEDYFHGKFSTKSLRDAPVDSIGMDAKVRGRGFSGDGSYFNNKASAAFSGTVPDYSNLRSGESFDGRGVRYLLDFLDTCRSRGIYVIGILPPTRGVVYDQLHLSGYHYWDELPKRLEPLFAERGFSFYDFSRPSLYGGNEDEFYDDFHASEAAYQRIADRLLASEKALRA